MMNGNAIDAHVAEIDRCNQRSARMLSVVDLLEAKTLTPELAAYLLAAISRGASYLVGALPGSAGKTTVMGALLNFVPATIALKPADSAKTIADALAHLSPRRCWICHEIGAGGYYAYLWGPALRAYFELGRAGHQLATNLHADTYEQARAQVCDENGVPLEDFVRMNLALFLRVRGGDRVVHEVWESDGASVHRRIFAGGRLAGGRLADPERVAQAGKTLDALMATGGRTIGDVRQFLVKSSAV
ncbi:MAG: hypothetical protein AAB152_15765 [Candidatus Coatesbacteria bacterium]